MLGEAIVAAAAALAPCGPPNADTLAANATTRVYASGGQVAGCHRAARRTRPLGPRAALSKVQVAGRHAAIVRIGGPVERLQVHDLRRGSLQNSVGTARGQRFARIRLDRTGLAAYLVQSLTEQPSTVRVGVTGDPTTAYGPDVDPTVLGLAGRVVAHRRGATYHLDAMWDRRAARRTLLRAGGVAFTVVRGSLWARRLHLGSVTDACMSSSGCSGVDALQVSGRFVAVRDSYYASGESGGHIRVYDRRSGRRRALCHSAALTTGGVGSFVLTETGSLACALRAGHWEDATFEIRSEGKVLDSGEGIDVDSLTRRGDRLVWVHDGVERTAPLPGG